MESASRRRVLVVANRTAATPDLLEEVQRLARERPTDFVLLIPDASGGSGDWTLELAVPLIERAAGGPVTGLAAEGEDPVEAIRRTIDEQDVDEIMISTLPRRVSAWLRRDLPHQVEKLGLPVSVITPNRERLPDRVPTGAGGAGGAGTA
jgi:hypothetical protein